jgi:hypothetical protein
MRRLCALTDEPAIKAATGAQDALGLFATFPKDVVWRVPDSALVAFSMTFAASLAQVPPATCAAIYPRPGAPSWLESFMTIAQAADSQVSERWADVLESWARASVTKAPLQPVATSEQAIAHIREQSYLLTAADRRTMVAITRNEPAAHEAVCHALQGIFVSAVSGDPARAAAAFRAIMSGLAPLIVAT